MKALLLIALAACTTAAAQPDDKSVAGKQAFGTVYKVLLDPRCRNCHPAGDAPLQGADGHPHANNVTRRSTANGLTCATCHRARNGVRPNTPPGAPNWHLPPADMPLIFEGRTPHALCEQLKDPTQTGGRDLAAILHHVQTDALVGWGWDPGPGRAPVAIPRATLVTAMQAWIDAGAPCPD